MPNNLISLNKALEDIKSLIENAITTKGESGKKSVINSKKTINILHEVVKSELIKNGVNANLIHPPLGTTSGEKKLAGFLKFKDQDVCVFPNHLTQVSETLLFNGLHTNKNDPFGELFTEHILTINIRSQLSSLSKNIDTMYERTYAEPINLHRRLPKMVLGEVYLVSVRELDSEQVKLKNVVYKPITTSTANQVEKYISGFSALNKRENQRDDDFKYERVALLLVDFSCTPIKIYSSDTELKADNLLPEDTKVSINNLTFDDYIKDLIKIYERRFGTGKFI